MYVGVVCEYMDDVCEYMDDVCVVPSAKFVREISTHITCLRK